MVRVRRAIGSCFGRLRVLVVGMSEVVVCRENRVCSFNCWRCAGSGFVCVFWEGCILFDFSRLVGLRCSGSGICDVFYRVRVRERRVCHCGVVQVSSTCWSSMRLCKPPV